MLRRIVIGLMLALLSSGCAMRAQEGPAPASSESAVSNCEFSQWIGKPVEEIPVRTMGRPYRILPPNSMTTMDHIPNRINVYIDGRGMVIKVRCG